MIPKRRQAMKLPDLIHQYMKVDKELNNLYNERRKTKQEIYQTFKEMKIKGE